MERATTKIDAAVLNRIKKHIKKTGQTVFSFLNLTVTEKLDSIDSDAKSYGSIMTEYLMKQSNKKKK